jgi:hypothetical protein
MRIMSTNGSRKKDAIEVKLVSCTEVRIKNKNRRLVIATVIEFSYGLYNSFSVALCTKYQNARQNGPQI